MTSVLVTVLMFTMDLLNISLLTFLHVWFSEQQEIHPLLQHIISYQHCTNSDPYEIGLVQDCSISSRLAIEVLQFCTKLPIWIFMEIPSYI